MLVCKLAQYSLKDEPVFLILSHLFFFLAILLFLCSMFFLKLWYFAQNLINSDIHNIPKLYANIIDRLTVKLMTTVITRPNVLIVLLEYTNFSMQVTTWNNFWEGLPCCLLFYIAVFSLKQTKCIFARICSYYASIFCISIPIFLKGFATQDYFYAPSYCKRNMNIGSFLYSCSFCSNWAHKIVLCGQTFYLKLRVYCLQYNRLHPVGRVTRLQLYIWSTLQHKRGHGFR